MMKHTVTLEIELPECEFTRDEGDTWHHFNWTPELVMVSSPIMYGKLRRVIQKIKRGETVSTSCGRMLVRRASRED